jgi:histidine kinase
VREVHKPITARRGYFISGKFDQLKKNIPYSALLQALRQLVRQILSEPEQNIAVVRQILLQNLEGYGQLIIEVIPELELLIGRQPPVPELPAAEAQNRFREFLTQFILPFATRQHPLTIFIDDLQWADLSTIQLLQRLAQAENNQYIYIIGAFRNNEVNAGHPLSMVIKEMQESGVDLRQLKLRPLPLESANQFVADALKADPAATTGLTDLLDKKTGSNPFFIKVFLHQLVDEKLLWLDRNRRAWQWDLGKIQQLAITDNVVELLTHKMERITPAAQQLLKIAACLGNEFDLITLHEVAGHAPHEVARQLWEPLSTRFILPLSESYKTAETLDQPDGVENVRYRFSHDRVQQAAYNLMDEQERLKTHWHIAQTLWKNLAENHLEERLFDLTNHFNQALPLISSEADRRIVCSLNLRAAAKAKESVAYPVARSLFQTAVQLFPSDAWKEQYNDTFSAYLQLAECEYICGNYDAAEKLYQYILQNAADPDDQARVYEIQLQQYAQQGRNREVLELGAAVLKRYGVHYIAEPSMLQVLPRLISAKLLLAGKDVSALIDAPKITNRTKAHAIQTLMTIAATAYVHDNKAMLLLVIRMVQLSVRYGNAPESAFGYGLFGFIEGAALGNVEQCRKFAELSLQLAARYDNPIIRGKVLFLKAFSTQHWYEPIPESLPVLREAFKMLVNSGSNVFASYSLMTIASKEMFLGLPLPKVYADIIEYSNFTDRVSEYYSQNLLMALRRYGSGLTGVYHDHYRDRDTNLEEETYVHSLRENRLLMALAWHYVYSQMLHWMMGDLDKAQHYREKAGLVDEAAPTTMAQIEHYFYNVLLDASRYPDLSVWEKTAARFRVWNALAKLRKWMNGCPVNFRARYHLAHAAWMAAIDRPKAAECFEQALHAARETHSLHLQAICHELRGRYLERKNRPGEAAAQLKAAVEAYLAWGATAKANLLLKEYHRYFAAALPVTDHKATDVIDLEAVLRASQAISGEIVLGNLLSRLLTILMENVGAQRGMLILNRENNLLIEAEHTLGTTAPRVMQSESLTDSDELSVAVVYYVWRSGESVLIDDAQQSNPFSSDAYLARQGVRSLLCIPVINQGKISAIVYFENNLAANAFTRSRLNLATMLASQAAISIDNAMLYNNLELMVQERTRELAGEKKKTDELLLNILPAEIAEELKEKGHASAKFYEQATILFCDFRNFTQMAENTQPATLVKLIDLYFSQFDGLMQEYGVEKIKTVGDAYIAAGGLPDPEKGRPEAVVRVALEMARLAGRIRAEHEQQGLPFFELRIGIHTGPVIAGVVGVRKFAYDIWGDTVNTAARMEENSKPGKVNISGATYQLVSDIFTCTYRGKVAAKHKGEIDMYFVEEGEAE